MANINNIKTGDVNIPGALHSTAGDGNGQVGNVVAYTGDVYDVGKNANQASVNSELSERLSMIELQTEEFLAPPVYNLKANLGGVQYCVKESYITESFSSSQSSFDTQYITISGNPYRTYGLAISDNNAVTISSKHGVKIMRVEYIINKGLSYADNIRTTKGTIDYSNKTINDINDTSLEIFSEGVSGQFTLKSLTVYYGLPDISPIDEYDSVVSFTTTSGENYSQDDVTVTSTSSSSYGLQISDNNSVTIATNGNGPIVKVDVHLRFYSNTDDEVVSSNGVVSGSGYDWTIDNVNSTSLTISHPGTGNTDVTIDGIVVYCESISGYFSNFCTTFYSSAANYQVPEGTEIYKAVFEDYNTLNLIRVRGGIINKGLGVILRSSVSDITLTKVYHKGPCDYNNNDLLGTDVNIVNPNPGNAMAAGFTRSFAIEPYLLDNDNVIPANTCYLVYAGESVSNE